jgi:hypothetical protein
MGWYDLDHLEDDLELTKSNSGEIRMHAALCLGLPDEGNVPPSTRDEKAAKVIPRLMEILRSNDDWGVLVLGAADSLGSYGPLAKEAIPHLERLEQIARPEPISIGLCIILSHISSALEKIMGLRITVGVLASLAENDPQGAKQNLADFEAIKDLFRQHGLPEHEEPTSLPMLGDRSGVSVLPYPFRHYLRRFYARRIAQPDQIPPPVVDGENPAGDPVFDEACSHFHHLLRCFGRGCYYVPVDFTKVLDDERIAGGSVGSSVRLLDELIAVAAPLGVVLRDHQLNDADANAIAKESKSGGPYWIERLVWLALFEAARLSIEHRAAIHLG